MFEDKKIAVIGLGYVGLPLVLAFGRHFPVVAYDINQTRIDDLREKKDYTGAALEEDFNQAKKVIFSGDERLLSSANIFIITVPTPVNESKAPDLSAVESATKLVALNLKKGDWVILESTVYPGVTEEVCVPILEKDSGLLYNKDFFCAYAPERVNPGDSIHDLTKVKKVVAGSNHEITKKVAALYSVIIEAGVFEVAEIKVAEAAKVIENAQRDVNIAFVNELAKIFSLMNIDTQEVLRAAETKWNFLSFQPGLVGGHCIGVDPYYLAFKAQQLGYNPEVILSGRKTNDGMGVFVAHQFMKLLVKKGIILQGANVLVLGFTFKENIGDIRNTRVADIVRELESFGLNVSVYDPYASIDEVKKVYGITLLKMQPSLSDFDGTIVAVGHKEFLDLEIQDHIIYDVKGIYPKNKITARL